MWGSRPVQKAKQPAVASSMSDSGFGKTSGYRGFESLPLRHRFSAAKKSFKISHFQNRRILAVEHPGGAPVGIFYHFLAAASREKSPPIGGKIGRFSPDFVTVSSLHDRARAEPA